MIQSIAAVLRLGRAPPFLRHRGPTEDGGWGSGEIGGGQAAALGIYAPRRLRHFCAVHPPIKTDIVASVPDRRPSSSGVPDPAPVGHLHCPGGLVQ